MQSLDTPLEEEVTLVVCSPDPGSVMRELAQMESIARARLVPGESLTIRDTYFDTRSRILQSRGWALRIRTIGPTRVLALKGGERLNEWGAITRIEIEADWSEEILDRALGKLRETDIPLPDRSGPFDPLSPVKTLEELGLEILQHRRMFRRIRRIYAESDRSAGPPDAELCLDTVRFDLANVEVEHNEVEIEIMTAEGRKAAPRMVEVLVGLFPGALRVWPHNKLAVGLALERLARRGDPVLSVCGGALSAEAYHAIDGICRALPSRPAPEPSDL